jgi:histone H3/H4
MRPGVTYNKDQRNFSHTRRTRKVSLKKCYNVIRDSSRRRIVLLSFYMRSTKRTERYPSPNSDLIHGRRSTFSWWKNSLALFLSYLLNIVALLIARSFHFSSFEYSRAFSRSLFSFHVADDIQAVALRDMWKFQKFAKLLIKLISFSRLAKKIMTENINVMKRVQASALTVMQKTTKAYIVSLLKDKIRRQIAMILINICSYQSDCFTSIRSSSRARTCNWWLTTWIDEDWILDVDSCSR